MQTQQQGTAVSEQRFEDLEVRLAYQDQTLSELNEVLTDQQARLIRLERQVEILAERLRGLGEAGETPTPGDEKPPHY